MNQEQLKITQLLDLSHSIANRLLSMHQYPWEVMPNIAEFIVSLGQVLPEEEYNKLGDKIWIHKSAQIAQSVCIGGGAAVICQGADIRHGAFIRGNVIVGAKAVVGNSVELKNSILFDRAQVPHFNYVGDSILGYYAHMGAGAVTSNVKSDKSFVNIHAEDGEIETGLKKFGAVLGDYAEVGCNSVLNPGTIIGRNSNVYPLSSVRGCVNSDSIYKKQGDIAEKNK